MKRIYTLAITAAVTLVALAGCSSAKDPKKIVVGASVTPHAKILSEATDILKEKGYELVIKEYSDYVQPNLAVQNKELDANFFQHQPYLDDFNVKQKTDLVSIGSIHYEPLGIYVGKTKTLADLQDGAVVAVPNDSTNEARALILLEVSGLIKLNPDAGFGATVADITENPKNLEIKEIEAAQLARSLQDVDIAVINGNYAIEAGLKVSDALAAEDSNSLSAETFANIIAVRKGDENREDLKALVEAVKSAKVKAFIEQTYQGAVVPLFE